MSRRKIEIGYVARVEGEAGLKIKVAVGQVKDLVLDVWEPPRFFEGFLMGRKYYEVPDLVSRRYTLATCDEPPTHGTPMNGAVDVNMMFPSGR